MADAEGISLEETNKIRISLGLKPLTDDKASGGKQEATAEDNYAKRKEEERQKRERSELQTRIEKNKNKRELNRRLLGSTLGDVDDAGDDALSWVKRSKKQEKKLAAKRQAELDSRDAQTLDNYGEKDLEGLKVSHDFEDLDEGENRILTLKDSRILDNEEDELHDAELAEIEKDKKRKDLKTKGKGYTGYDDDEFAADGSGGLKKSVLAKYDEEINGDATETGFRLGAASMPTKNTQRNVHEQAAAAVNKTLLSIDYAKNQEISDYAEDKGFKKLKTKKKKASRRVPADQELADPSGEPEAPQDEKMIVDEPVAPRERNLDANFVDDEDLQAALARSRRQKVKRAKITPEEIAARLKEAEAEETPLQNGNAPMTDTQNDQVEDGGLTFDDTTEFVRNIAYDPTPQPPRPIAITIRTQRSPERDEAVTEMDVDVKRESGEETEGDMEEEDQAALNFIEQAINGATGGEKEEPVDQIDGLIGTSNETFSGGLAGTLSILRKQGVVGSTEEVANREKIQKNHDKWLADNRHRLAMQEIERLRAKSTTKDQNQREYENRMREQHDARDLMSLYKEYKPDVEIKYYDEFGREMDKKEAWKALSHRFHGKGSGKMKTEKRLKKIADEKKRASMASGDTPTSMNDAFQKRQAKAGTAHMVLSVGNRGAVPQLEDVLDNAALSKASKASKPGKGKKKEAGINSPLVSVDMTSFASANTQLAPNIVPIPVGQSDSAEGSPAPAARMKPAFARIGGADTPATSTPVGSGNATPVAVASSADRHKVRIGFGVKRKVGEDDGASTPPSKRR